MANEVTNGRPLHVPSLSGDLPVGWQWKRLDEVCAAVFDCPHSTPILTDDGPFVVRTQDVRTGVFRTDIAARVSEATYQDRIRRAEPQFGDLLFSREGTYFGIAAEVPFDTRVCLGQRMVLLRPQQAIADARFLKYWLNSPILASHVSGHRDGTVAERLNMPTIRALPVPEAPIKQQRRIGEILGAFDDKIELNRRMNATLEATARALFKSWFIDFDPVHAKATGRKAPHFAPATAKLFPDRFVNSPLGKVPEGWRAVPLPDAFDVNPTRQLAKGTVAPYLEMANMPTASARAIAWENREFGSGMRFVNGDTLVARITPCLENGKTAFVDFLADKQIGWGSTEYIVLRPKPPLPPSFGYFLARTNEFRAHVVANMTGTSGRQRAPAECLDKFLIVAPPMSITDRFGELVSGMLGTMRTNDEQSANLATARDALLPKLLRGELI